MEGREHTHTHTLWPPSPWELGHREEVHGIPQHLPAAPRGFGHHRVRFPKASPSPRCTSWPWLLEVEGHTWQRLSGAFCSLLVFFSLCFAPRLAPFHPLQGVSSCVHPSHRAHQQEPRAVPARHGPCPGWPVCLCFLGGEQKHPGLHELKSWANQDV